VKSELLFDANAYSSLNV